ncbi:hypothetical protein ACTA71_000136 [Dictyostelium dimigraforme]
MLNALKILIIKNQHKRILEKEYHLGNIQDHSTSIKGKKRSNSCLNNILGIGTTDINISNRSLWLKEVNINYYKVQVVQFSQSINQVRTVHQFAAQAVHQVQEALQVVQRVAIQ